MTQSSELQDELKALRQRVAELEQNRGEFEQRYRYLHEEGLIGLVVVGEDMRILDINNHMGHSLGYEPAEVIGRMVTDFVTPRQRDKIIALLMAEIEGRDVPEVELDLVGRAGVRKFLFPGRPAHLRGSGPRDSLLISGIDITERRLAERQLSSRDDETGRMLNDLNGFLWTATVIPPWTWDHHMPATRGFERLTGYSPAELWRRTGIGINGIVPAEYVEQKDRLGRKAVAGAIDNYYHEFPIIHRDGGIRWVAESVCVASREANRVTLTGVCLDITERRRAEEDMHRWKERTRQVLDGISAFVWLARVRKPFQWSISTPSGEAFERVTGYSDPEIQEHTDHILYKIVLQEDLKAKDELGRRAIIGEYDEYGQEYRIRHKNGQVRWIAESARVTRRDGDRLEIMGVCIDITDRKKAEEELRQWEEQTRRVLDGMSAFLWTAEAGAPKHWKLKMASNEAFRRITGYSCEEIIETGAESQINAIVLPEDIAAKDKDGHRAVDGDYDEYYHEYRIRHKNGQVRWIGESARVVSRKGPVCEVMGVCIDITDRKRAEQALDAAHRQLMIAREEERRHLARELHDSIGQSLVVLQLSVRNTLNGLESSPRRDLTEELSLSVDKCNALIAEVRSICRGLYPPVLESLGLPAALRALARDCQTKFETRVLFDLALETRRFPFEVEIALYRIAQEAAQNALRHSHAKHFAICLTHDDGQAELTLQDDGVGFNVPTIGQGGLGLNTMRERARAINGELKVESEPGETTVTVSVPTELAEIEEDQDDDEADG